jgi:hypothetical protein
LVAPYPPPMEPHLFGPGDYQNLVVEIWPLVTAIHHFEGLPKRIAKVAAQVVNDLEHVHRS